MAAITHCCKKKTKKKKKKEQKPPPSCHHRHLQSALDRFPISSACNYHRLHQTAQSDSSTTTHAHHHLFCPTLLAYCAMPTVVYNNYTDHLPASGPAPMADTGDRNGGVRGKKKKKKKKIPVCLPNTCPKFCIFCSFFLCFLRFVFFRPGSSHR
jgi:hypothetical protein